jgi:hypothetical protein
MITAKEHFESSTKNSIKAQLKECLEGAAASISEIVSPPLDKKEKSLLPDDVHNILLVHTKFPYN